MVLRTDPAALGVPPAARPPQQSLGSQSPKSSTVPISPLPLHLLQLTGPPQLVGQALAPAPLCLELSPLYAPSASLVS